MTSGTSDNRYSVQSSDTLSKIAAKFGVSVDALVAANQQRYPGITNPKSLQSGWSLQIPKPEAQPSAPATPAAPAWKPKSNDKVLFVAVNNSDEHRSTDESKALIARGTDVTVVQTSKVQDTITAKDAAGNPKTFDLTKPEGAMGFALTLGLPGDQTKQIADVISGCQDGGRDEVAGIAQEWANAERGGQTESRLVLSGHQTGSGVYGDNNGKITWETLAGLARAMPRGAASVEDLMIAGCFSGGERMMDMYQGMFPNLHTAVAYSGLSPGSASGATAHQKAWEQATRGDRDTIDRDIFKNMRWGDHVAVWSKAGGYQDGNPPQTLDDAKQQLSYAKYSYDSALAGTSDIGDPTTGPVRAFYTQAQHLLQRRDLPPEDVAALTEQKDQAIRLVFYGQVAQKFNQTNAAQLAAGYQSLGLPVPDFSKLSRADAVAQIDAYQAALGAKGADATDAQRTFGAFMTDFKELKTSVIPEAWV